MSCGIVLCRCYELLCGIEKQLKSPLIAVAHPKMADRFRSSKSKETANSSCAGGSSQLKNSLKPRLNPGVF